MNPRGIPIAQIDAELESDPKFRRLERKLDTLHYLAALGAYISIVLRAWASASREADPDFAALLLPELVGELQGVGLLDDDGAIPEDVYEKWVGTVAEQREERRERLAGIAGMGGRARIARAARDTAGRLQAAPAEVQPPRLESPAITAGASSHNGWSPQPSRLEHPAISSHGPAIMAGQGWSEAQPSPSEPSHDPAISSHGPAITAGVSSQSPAMSAGPSSHAAGPSSLEESRGEESREEELLPSSVDAYASTSDAAAAASRSDRDWVAYVVDPEPTCRTIEGRRLSASAERVARFGDFYAARMGRPMPPGHGARVAKAMATHPGGIPGLMSDLSDAALKGVAGDPLDYIAGRLRRTNGAGRRVAATDSHPTVDYDAFVIQS